MTYSGMPEGHTTIGAERFHFRVRNGIGWFHTAIVTRERVEGRQAVLDDGVILGLRALTLSEGGSNEAFGSNSVRRVVESKAT